jgi:hypothetical protein
MGWGDAGCVLASPDRDHVFAFRLSMQADKFGIMAKIFEQIMDTVRLRSPES